jgi:hypothetical protein
MFPDTDEAAIQADAYIDALLAGHAHVPVALGPDGPGLAPLGREAAVRDAIHLLEKGLPRFHPSFVFEEWLADQLRRAASGGDSADVAEIIPIAVIPHSQASGAAVGLAVADRRFPDRRLIVGGAIASGVSIAGAAVIAWRRSRN